MFKMQEICPYCEQKFSVVNYGRCIPCPNCGGKLDIFPDSDVWISTPWGQFGISVKLTQIFKGMIKFGG